MKPMLHHLTNWDITAWNKRDHDAYKVVYLGIYPALCLYAEKLSLSPEDAEDVVEDIFVKLWHNKSEFQNANHLKAYLYKSVKNASLNYQVTAQHAKERQFQFVLTEPDHQVPPDTIWMRAEIMRQLYQAIETLPDTTATIIRMSFIEGRSNQEIANVLNLSLQTVKNRKSDGLAQLRGKLSPMQFTLLVYFSFFT